MEGVCLMAFLGCCGILLFARVEGRQMCLSCQYLASPDKQGLECASDPWSWAWGNTRMRCPHRCFFEARFHGESGEVLYMYRGCTQEDRRGTQVDGEEGEGGEEGCTVNEDENTEVCWTSCVDVDYCNNRTFTLAPSKELASNATGADSDGGGLSGYLYAFYVLLAVFALFVVLVLSLMCG